MTELQVIARKTKEQLEIEIPLTESILAETKNQKQLYHAAYESRSVKRGAEIKIIQSAYNLINDQVSLTRKTEALSDKLN